MSNKTPLTTEKLLFLLVILLSFLVACYENYPALINDYIKTDDARANIFWLHQLNDPKLFVDDYLTRYAIFYEATGSYYLYSLASFFIDPFLLEKIMPIILLVVCGIFLFLIGNSLGGPFTGLVFALLFMLFPNHNDFFNAGYSRVFAFPGVIIFIYFLSTQRLGHLIWFMPLIALFYPIVFLLNALCYSLWVGVKLSIRRYDPTNHLRADIAPKTLLGYFLLSIALSAMVILPKYALPNAEFGELLNYQQIIDDPGAYQNGRNWILPPQPLHQKILQELGHPFVISCWLFILFALGLSFFKRIPIEFWLYMLSGLLLYEIAYSLLLKLYFPYKYFLYSFSIMLFFMLSYGLGSYIDQLKQLKQKLFSLAILVIWGMMFYSHSLIPARGMDDYSEQAFLYQYINTLPKNSLLAATPYMADNIPLFAARAVLFNHELASPWFTTYSQTIRQRISDFYQAYYADNSAAIIKFMQKYQVSHMLVDQRDFQNLERAHFYINPFDDLIKRLVKTNRGHFYLQNNIQQSAQFHWQGYYVINLRQLQEDS